ncbi:hypothetical protein BGZ97_002545 [Linnemannia gamsii]|uniref:Uncharacterized protein n=1 Tax=Linnemannia gamsii TaxID=64522 RepID=A0A9P6QWZ9_9FUNG|nr:hypothetical protein BGZ97_002545 [Linnemannia gamsii]
MGATGGGIVGILKQKPVGSYAFSGGLNASLFGMTFIAFRESFLRLQREKNPYYGLKNSQTMDIDHLWSSTVAGACTGGILAALARGAKAVPSGTFMFGVMAMGGQWVLTKTNRTDVDEYEVKLKQKLELIEKEEAFLKEEALRRKRLAVAEAVEEKAV